MRDFVTGALNLTGATSPLFSNSGLYTILTFHRILPADLRQQYPLPVLVITPEELEWVLSYCRQHYSCGSLADTIGQWKRRAQEKRPLMAITFDDGQEDNYRYALPVLEKLGLTATFFVPVKNIETANPLWHDILGFSILHLIKTNKQKLNTINELLDLNLLAYETPIDGARAAIRKAKSLTNQHRIELTEAIIKNNEPCCPRWAGMMNWQQLREMDKKGHEIGSHSMTHPILPKCPKSMLHTEITKSRRILQERMDSPIESFCYPNGDYNEQVLRMTKSAGYSVGVTTKWKANNHDDSLFELGRCDIDPKRIINRSGELSQSRLAWRLSKFRRILNST